MAKLHAVPESPPRALGMIRVSKERDGMMSPEVQRVAITDAARRRGYTIVDWVEGIDESGSRAKSAWWPRLDQAVAGVQVGDYDVILVWKFSRAARHRLKWATAIDKVETAGGRLESATEDVDTTTSTGQFTRGMLAELSVFEAKRIGEGWKEVHEKRLADGSAPNGKPRFGYIWDPVQKLHVPDPETGPVLAETYRRYVGGESVYSLVRWLNASQIRTTANRPWSDRALRRVLDAGFAAGIIRWRGAEHAGRHDRLIDDTLWQDYLDARIARRAIPARTQRSQYALSGLVRCGRCGGAMAANNPGPPRSPSFRCTTSKEQGPEACAGGYVAMSVVEEAAVEWLREVEADVDAARESAALRLARKLDAEAEQRRVQSRLDAIEKAVKKVRRGWAEDLLSDAELHEQTVEYREERAALEDRLDDLGRTAREAGVDTQALARALLEGWDDRTTAGKRSGLSRLIHHVEVVTSPTRTVAGVQGGSSSAKVTIVPA